MKIKLKEILFFKYGVVSSLLMGRLCIMEIMICLVLAALTPSYSAQAFQGAVGLGLGGNFTSLISDQSTGLLATGISNQYSLYVAAFRDKPLAIKFRIEELRGREESWFKSDTSYFQPQTTFRSAEQNWTIYSLGVEKVYQSRSLTLSWELGLGYAVGRGGTFTLSPDALDQQSTPIPVSQVSCWALHGGMGVRRAVIPNLNVIADGRAYIFSRNIYNQDPLASKFVSTIPLMFSLSFEYEFDIK